MNILRLHCIDQPGIVAAVANALSYAQCNIEESSQFFDPHSGRFFMRVVYRGLTPLADQNFKNAFPAITKTYQMNWEIHDARLPVKTTILVGTADHCLHDLLYRARANSLNIDITQVISNHDLLRSLAQNNSIPFHVLAQNRSKIEQEKEIENLVEKTGSELILLARYMQILSPELCNKYDGRIINIHHSFLPGFKGAKPYHQAYDRGVKIIGATAHFATLDLDEGPIIAQGVEDIDHAHLPDKMQQFGSDIECRVLAKAVRLYTERRIFLHGKRTVIL